VGHQKTKGGERGKKQNGKGGEGFGAKGGYTGDTSRGRVGERAQEKRDGCRGVFRKGASLTGGEKQKAALELRKVKVSKGKGMDGRNGEKSSGSQDWRKRNKKKGRDATTCSLGDTKWGTHGCERGITPKSLSPTSKRCENDVLLENGKALSCSKKKSGEKWNRLDVTQWKTPENDIKGKKEGRGKGSVWVL